MKMVLFFLLTLNAGAAELRYFFVTEKGESTAVPMEWTTRSKWTQESDGAAHRILWRKFSGGMETTNLTLERSDTTGSTLILLRFSQGTYGFKVVGEPGEGRWMEEWVLAEKCVAGINGGYFFLRPESRSKIPLGLTLKAGKSLAAYRANYSGCFYVGPNGADFSVKEPPPAGATEAVQSFPMVLTSGEIPPQLKHEKPALLHIHDRRRRAGVGRDWAGNIIFLATTGEITFFEFGFVAGALGLKDCLNLDGGGSAQLVALTRPPLRLPGAERVPIGIGVYRKD